MPRQAIPRVSKTAGQDAIDAIVERRRQVRDPDLDGLLRSDPGENPLSVVRHVLSCQRVPDWVLVGDVIDGLWVLAYIRVYCAHRPEEAERLEHGLLELGRAKQVALIRMAPPLNVRTRQAVEHRILRHRAAQLGLGRNERHERAHRLSQAASRPASAEAQWYDRHGLALWEAAADLVKCRARLDHLIDDELAESIIELRRAVRRMRWPLTPEHYSTLREIGWWLGEIVDELNEDRYARFREEAGELVPRVARLVADQHRARFGDE
ncbi:hypothetical protein [Nonomuraea sp. NPDC050783]|uniref:hypothetical protein n=1 Tax=Nonomuraea sp. NPDC050783 TaxID=3154634 RepID=UPI0034652718